MSYLYHTFFYDPIYNLLMLSFSFMPAASVGISIILVTILVRFLIYPLSKKAILTQIKMAEMGPALAEIKEKYKDNAEEQARKTLALYKEHGVNPFSGVLVIIIQIPVILALFQIFLHLPEVKGELLYSFVSAPESINMAFLGIFDLTAKSVILAFLAGVSTFVQLKIFTRGQVAPKGNSFGDNLTRSMQKQMKYVLPFIVFFISTTLSGAIPLYWLTTNLFSICQELFIRRNIKALPQRA